MILWFELANDWFGLIEAGHSFSGKSLFEPLASFAGWVLSLVEPLLRIRCEGIALYEFEWIHS